MTLSCGCVIQ